MNVFYWNFVVCVFVVVVHLITFIIFRFFGFVVRIYRDNWWIYFTQCWQSILGILQFQFSFPIPCSSEWFNNFVSCFFFIRARILTKKNIAFHCIALPFTPSLFKFALSFIISSFFWVNYFTF